MIAGVGALVRRERLARDWSLKGLAHGICAVSYLSKIERGEADPSPEVTGALLERLGIAWRLFVEEQQNGNVERDPSRRRIENVFPALASKRRRNEGTNKSADIDHHVEYAKGERAVFLV